MRSLTSSHHYVPIRRALGRLAWRIALAFVLAALATSVYRASRAPIAAPSASAGAASNHNPAMQSFLGYLQAERSSQPVRPASTPADPAQQAVMRYLGVHTTPTPAPLSAWDAAVQAVRSYVRAHDR